MATENPTTRTNRTRTFTDTWIKGRGPLSASEWADQASPGLRLRTTAKGTKTFFYRYRLNGTVDKITIGTYPSTSLQVARAKWQELHNLRRKGIDPKTHLKEQAEQQRQAELDEAQRQTATVARLVSDYLATISTQADKRGKPSGTFRKSWEGTQYNLSRGLAQFMAHQASEVTRGDVRDVLGELRDENKNVMANRTLAAIRVMYNWGIDQGWPVIKEGKKTVRLDLLNMNPAWRVKATEETPRQRALSEKELRTVLRNLHKSSMAEIYQDVLLVVLLTGCRSGEACSMKWQHVHDDEWTLPPDSTKNGRQHVVYLSRQAQTILAKYAGGIHVFDNPESRSGHIRRDGVSARLQRAQGVANRVPEASRKNRIGVEPFVVHDLRRTLGTWLGENRVGKEVRDRMLNHYQKTIDATYNVAEYNQPARKWWNKWGDHIEGLRTSNVVSIRRTK